MSVMVNLYLDYARCIDFTDDCPKSCFRARITKDVDKVPDYVLLSWVHFGEMDGCPKQERIRK